MPIQAKQQKKIINILDDLPPEKVDEIIDFAEYLKKKKAPRHKAMKKAPLKVPVFHLGQLKKYATDRETLYREYLDRKLD